MAMRPGCALRRAAHEEPPGSPRGFHGFRVSPGRWSATATISATALSQSAWAWSMICGAVGPTGLPKIQLMPKRIRLTPGTRMILPVATGGKKRRIVANMGAIRIEMTPAALMAPMIARALGGAVRVGHGHHRHDGGKVTPIITGWRMPSHCVAPGDWIRVTIPQTMRSERSERPRRPVQASARDRPSTARRRRWHTSPGRAAGPA